MSKGLVSIISNLIDLIIHSPSNKVSKSASTILAVQGAQVTTKPIAIEIIDNDLFVKAFVNGKGPFNFVVDTGASGIGRLDERIVKELGLVAIDSTKNYDGSGKYQMVPLLRVNTLQIGDIEIENVELLSRNYNTHPKKDKILTDGIIGRDFFLNYLLIVDGPGRKIVCSTDSLHRDDAEVLRYNEKNYKITIDQKRKLFKLE